MLGRLTKLSAFAVVGTPGLTKGRLSELEPYQIITRPTLAIQLGGQEVQGGHVGLPESRASEDAGDLDE